MEEGKGGGSRSLARIFDFDAEGAHEIDAAASHDHDVVALLGSDHPPLVTGPSDAKLALVKHGYAHHPTDGQIIAYAKKYFRATERLRGRTEPRRDVIRSSCLGARRFLRRPRC